MTSEKLTDGWGNGRLFLWGGPAFGTEVLETRGGTFGGVETAGGWVAAFAWRREGFRLNTSHVAIPAKQPHEANDIGAAIVELCPRISGDGAAGVRSRRSRLEPTAFSQASG